MFVQIIELDDNRFLGCSICEITAIPQAESIHTETQQALLTNTNMFQQMLNEIYHLSAKNESNIELLWVSEPAKNQVFNSKVRLFLVYREIGYDRYTLTNSIETIQGNCIAQLTALSYVILPVDLYAQEFNQLIEQIDCECVNATIKTEKCYVNSNALFPYYHCSLFCNDNNDNFNNIVEVLSRHNGTAIAFQLFSTQFTMEEGYIVNEMTSALSNVLNGFVVPHNGFYRDQLALEAFEYYNYYLNNIRQPIFTYNILTYGNSQSSNELSAKIQGLLQGSKQNVEVETINVENSHVNLSKDFVFYPWNINSHLIYQYRNKQLWENMNINEALFRMPYLITAKEATAFFGLPIDDGNVVAITPNLNDKVKEVFSNHVISEDNIRLGKLASDENIIIGCPEKTFTKHALIVGMPGSGKTTFSVNLLLQFTHKNIPFLAIEPTKTEYRAMIDVVPNLQIFTPGNNNVSPFIINPFIPPKGICVEQYIPSLANAFKAAFSMPTPLDVIFMKAIKNCYTEYGWKDYSKYGDNDVQVFGLYEFILTFKKLIQSTGYSKEVKGNLESGGLLRLSNLIEQNSNIYDTIHTVPIEDILSKPTVLELNSIDNAEQKALIMALLLINVCLYTKHNNLGNGELKNVILIDEAHVLLDSGDTSLGNAKSQSTTIKALQDLIVEIRSYGTSIIVADQSPSKVGREIIANTDVKVAFRLVQSLEKELIADCTGMSEYEKHKLSLLKPGEAYVYYSELRSAQMLITEDIREKDRIRLNVSNDEIIDRMHYWDTRNNLLKPFFECNIFESCKNGCNFRVRSNAEYIANKLYNICEHKIKSEEDLKKYVISIPQILQNNIDYSDEERRRFLNCVKVKFLRKMLMERSFTLPNREKIQLLHQNREKTQPHKEVLNDV